MRLLLDSHILLWMIFDRRRLTARVLKIVEDDSSQLFVSRASLWEISAKAARGKLPMMPGVSLGYLLHQVEILRITVLPITDSYIERTESLSHHHEDPFDRILVAQALEEGLTILTADSDIPKYDAPVIWK